MRDAQDRIGRFEMRKCGERHQLVEQIGDIDALERIWILQIFRRDFHDHMVLILVFINDRYQALAEGVA